MSQDEKRTHFSSALFLKRLKERDRTATEELVQAYTETLYRTALGLGFDSHAARDLVQNVWTTFYDIAASFEGKSHVRTFLFGILYNKASEARRELKKFDTSDPIEEILESRFDTHGSWVKPPIDPERFLFSSETLDLIQKCIDALPLTQRMAFSLKEIDDHESTDICNILNVSVTNLGVLLYRARNRLRECVEGKSGEQPDRSTR